MKIYGISDGAVLQRSDEDVCSAAIGGDFDGVLRSSKGTVEKIGECEYRLTGIPAGGPYDITLSDDSGRLTLNDIYVGDIWLLAGQSNMEGAGRMREQDYEYEKSPDTSVRALYMDDEWRPAAARLHQLWLSSDPAHIAAFGADKKNHDGRADIKDFYPQEQVRGVGPGLYFALRMREKTGVPQGVIPAAVGGAPIEMWTPEAGRDNYYSAALRRIKLCGSNIRGMFWYQGEGYSGSLEEYDLRFESMRSGFAAVCGVDLLPSVQVQTFRCLLPWASESKESAYSWSRFRAHQTDMADNLPVLRTVASNDLELDDLIHLSAYSHEILGRRAADAMLGLIGGYETEPRLASITASPDSVVSSWYEISVRYDNICGKLISSGIPSGFALSEGDKVPAMTWMQHTSLCGDTVKIRTELTLDKLRYMSLWYGFGHDFYCNITDEKGHALPSMGPVSLSDI